MTTTAMAPIGRGGSKYLLRLPPTLYDRLGKLAKAEGMSKNTLIATLLAGAIGYEVIPTVAPDEPLPNDRAASEADTAADVLAQLRALVASSVLDSAVASPVRLPGAAIPALKSDSPVRSAIPEATA